MDTKKMTYVTAKMEVAAFEKDLKTTPPSIAQSGGLPHGWAEAQG